VPGKQHRVLENFRSYDASRSALFTAARWPSARRPWRFSTKSSISASLLSGSELDPLLVAAASAASTVSLDQVNAFLRDPHVIMFSLQLAFALGHSGLAALRPVGEKLMGARAYRVLFALFSVPMAGVQLIYFVNHRYNGMQLWMLQGIPGLREAVWALSAISFIFLYPATFNLAEVAAIQKPQVRIYETGIIRVTRHPQMVGQIMWCIAHSAWLGSSFALTTSAALIAHHAFGVWHGDYRLQKRFGEEYERLKKRTSVVPFLAIAEGRQTFEAKEFLRPAYLSIAVFIIGLYALHPTMIETFRHVGW